MESGAEVLKMLVNEEEKNIPYLIMFHSGDTTSKAKKLIKEYEQGMKDGVLDGHDDFRYIKIDCSKNFEDLISAVGIDTNELNYC